MLEKTIRHYTNNKLQIIFIENNLIDIPIPSKNKLSRDKLATVLSNLAYYGYALSQDAYMKLLHCDEKEIIIWWGIVEKSLRQITGDDKGMDQFVVYKNFPAEVIEKSEAEYWLNQILMYWGFPNEFFTQETKERGAIQENVTYKVLHTANESSVLKTCNSLLKLPARWTTRQWEQILFLIEFENNIDNIAMIPFKENLVKIAKYLIDQGKVITLKTATDVLRLAVAFSDGDIALREKCRFIKFKRKERRAFLNNLENCKNLEEDVSRRKEIWKKFIYQLHPGEYKDKYISVKNVYHKLYNNLPFKTFNSQLEYYFQLKDKKVFELLKNRPGEFLRRLHLSLYIFKWDAFDEFIKILPKLTVQQLLKIKVFIAKVNYRKYRAFPPKGNWNKLKIQEADSKKTINEDIVEQLILQINESLKNKMASVVSSVSLDARTEWIKLQTNDSDLSPYGRGTIFPIPKNINFIRTASYWKSGPTNENIWYDNGWNFFDKNWKGLGACCWDNIKFKNGAIFSGDPTNSKDAEGNACQMIDLYLKDLIEEGVYFAVWNVLCYSQLPFGSAKEVFAALQWGETRNKGKLFEPSRCQLSFPLTGKNFTKYIAYIDIMERKLVYIDANLNGNVRSAGANVTKLETLMPPFLEYIDALPSVYDLFSSIPKSDDGIKILYSDNEIEVSDEVAYIFKPENKNNVYDKLNFNDLLTLI